MTDQEQKNAPLTPEQLQGLLTKDIERTQSSIDLWSIETVKQLSIPSLAGLAGTFTLAGTKKIQAEDAVCPAIIFAVAAMLNVLNFYLCSEARRRHFKHMVNTLVKLMTEQPIYQEDFVPRFIRLWNAGLITLGWIIAFIVFIGGITLFKLVAVN